MKKIFYPITILAAAVMMLPVSCSKNISDRTANLPPLKQDNIDAAAGSWKPVLLAAPTDVAVAAPIATNTPDYVAQINEIKTWQAHLTDDEKEMVKYWTDGATLT